jgi:penicillin-binding protein 1A
MGTKQLPSANAALLAANGAPKPPDIKPPPVLTKRGADVLVRVEKLLDDAAKTSGEPARPVRPVSSTSAGFTDSFAAALPDSPAAPSTTRKK